MLRGLVSVVVAVLLLASAESSSARVTANGATFVDERGEQESAPDITRVVVSNDDAGLLRLRIDTPSHLVLTQDMRIRVFLTAHDTDYFLLVDPFKPVPTAQLYRCEPQPGGAVCSPQRASSLRFTYAGGARFAFDASEIGIESTLATSAPITFYVLTYAGIRYDPATGYDLSRTRIDRAPSDGSSVWTYVARFGPRKLVMKALAATPSMPRAGKRFTVRVQVLRSDTGALVTSGRVTCRARVADRLLQPKSQRFVAKRATCAFDIPPGTAGRLLRGSISVTFAGKTATRRFSRAIR